MELERLAKLTVAPIGAAITLATAVSYVKKHETSLLGALESGLPLIGWVTIVAAGLGYGYALYEVFATDLKGKRASVQPFAAGFGLALVVIAPIQQGTRAAGWVGVGLAAIAFVWFAVEYAKPAKCTRSDCSRNLPRRANYCPGCGQPVGAADTPSKPKTTCKRQPAKKTRDVPTGGGAPSP